MEQAGDWRPFYKLSNVEDKGEEGQWDCKLAITLLPNCTMCRKGGITSSLVGPARIVD